VGFDTDDERIRLNVHSEDLASLCTKLDALGVTPKRPWVVVHPGASTPSRRYPAPSIGAAAQLIAQRSHCQVLFTGSADEAGLIASAQAEMRPAGVSLAGQLSLGELVALIAHATLVVSNNSDPVHIAAALGTPVVDLHHDCLRLVTPMQVALAAQQLIELRPAAPDRPVDEAPARAAGAVHESKASATM
jgi:ADP-heptose:LPS heptosyltransferase